MYHLKRFVACHIYGKIAEIYDNTLSINGMFMKIYFRYGRGVRYDYSINRKRYMIIVLDPNYIARMPRIEKCRISTVDKLSTYYHYEFDNDLYVTMKICREDPYYLV